MECCCTPQILHRVYDQVSTILGMNSKAYHIFHRVMKLASAARDELVRKRYIWSPLEFTLHNPKMMCCFACKEITCFQVLIQFRTWTVLDVRYLTCICPDLSCKVVFAVRAGQQLNRVSLLNKM